MNTITNTLFIGKVLHFLEIVNSTNDYAKELLANTSPIHGTVILSFCQTNGRGQYGRKWQAEKNESIAMSVILKPDFPDTNTDSRFSLNKAVAIAVAECVRTIVGDTVEIKIKWPNDVLVNNRKISGILIENQYFGNKLKNSITGIGINVNQEGFPPEIPYAISMRMLDGERRIMNKVVDILAQKLEFWLTNLYDNKLSLIENTYNEWLWRKDLVTRFNDENGLTKEGIIHAVNNDGKLAISQNDNLRYYTFGTVSFDVNQ